MTIDRRCVSRAASVLATTAMLVGMTATAGMAARKPRVDRPTLTANVQPVTNSSAASFTFSSATTGADYTCQLDGLKKSSCTSPKAYVALAEGAHTFSVVATKRGARQSPDASFVWTIDRTLPPAVTFQHVPTTPVATSPDITFTGESGDTFTCQIDTTTAAPCSASTVQSTGTDAVTANGTHSLRVVPTDAAGNVGPAATAVWVVDHVGPVIAVSNPPASPNPLSAVTVDFRVTGADAPSSPVVCELKRGTTSMGAPSDCSSGTYATPPLSTDAVYTLTITATDAAGNQTQAQVVWTRDTTLGAPGLPPVLSGPAAYINDASPAAAAVSWDDTSGDSYQCAVDGSATFEPCDQPFIAGSAWSVGTHSVSVEDINTHSAASVWSWTLDQTPPTLTVTGGPGARTNADSVTFAVSAADDVALAAVTCTVSVDGVPGAPAPCPTDGVFPTTGEGAYTLDVVAADAAGNPTPVSKHFVVDHTPPVATIRGVNSLTGPISLTYGETVRGLAPGAVALTLTDTGVPVKAARTCWDAAAHQVSCGGDIRSIRLTPVAALTPGQHYSVMIADAAVRDLAGNGSAAVLPPHTFRGLRTLEENSVAVVPSWQKTSATSAAGGSYVREHRSGAQASYRFRGGSVSWLTVTGPTQGKALVRIDGHKKPVVNNYAAATHYRVARTFSKLGTGAHQLTITVLGREGARAGRGTFVSVDAFKVGQTVTKTPKLSATWKRIANTQLFAGHAATGDLAGESCSVVFRGVSVTWQTVTSRTQGIARVYVDGALKATVDNYSRTTRYHVARAVTGLLDGVHTLRIVVAGKHHAGGRGTKVTVDRIAVG